MEGGRLQQESNPVAEIRVPTLAVLVFDCLINPLQTGDSGGINLYDD